MNIIKGALKLSPRSFTSLPEKFIFDRAYFKGRPIISKS